MCISTLSFSHEMTLDRTSYRILMFMKGEFIDMRDLC
jgi:hypothetical protein